MSNPFGNVGGIQIYQDPENVANPGLRKTKRDDIPLKQQPANKRAALGLITNTTRVQPFRAAKQGLSTDNLEMGKCEPLKSDCGIPFSIFVDEESQSSHAAVHRGKSAGLQLRPQVASLKPAPLPLPQNEVITIPDSPVQESPMVLDTSLDQHRMHQDVEQTPEERLDALLMCSDYAEEIYRYMRELELRHRPKPGYMRKQPDITNSMRCILVDWLVEVAEEYKLHRETLFLTINYIDRFLSQMSVLRNKLQLVGAACMFLASKFEEIYPPELKEFVYVTDDTYTQKQILRMEHLVLKVLSFDVAIPTANCFLEKFLKDTKSSDKTKSLAMYLLELTLVDSEPYLNYIPSLTAASCLCLANMTLGQPAWTPLMLNSTGYLLSDLTACVKDLHQTFQNSPRHPQQAVREKYRHSSYHNVSSLSPPESLPFQ